jgi:outer membrane receptor protein involved in Fe transport
LKQIAGSSRSGSHLSVSANTQAIVLAAAERAADRNDVGGRYPVTDKLKAFVKADNLLNRDPVASRQTNTGLDMNPALYDTIGRIYRTGFRFNL